MTPNVTMTCDTVNTTSHCHITLF